MLKTLASIGLGAAFALTPPAVLAQNASPPPPKHHHYDSAHKPTGSYRSEMRRRGNASREHARAGAEHVRRMRQQ